MAETVRAAVHNPERARVENAELRATIRRLTIAAVSRWAVREFGRYTSRHEWAVITAGALLDGHDAPAWPGLRRHEGAPHLVMVRRIIADPELADG